MTTTDDAVTDGHDDPETIRREERDRRAVSKEQLRKLDRLMRIGSARLTESVSAERGNTGDSPGDYRIAFSLSQKVPFTCPYSGAWNTPDQGPRPPERMEAEAVCISSKGVHLLARPAALVGQERSEERRRESRWVSIDAVNHVEQAL